MIGLDTNILVRYLTQDDPLQSAKVNEEFERAADEETLLFVTSIVLCELVWVLEGAYGYDRREIGRVLENLLRTRQFRFDGKDQLWSAWRDYNSGKGDFADYLIGRIGQAADGNETITLDHSLGNSSLFRIL